MDGRGDGQRGRGGVGVAVWTASRRGGVQRSLVPVTRRRHAWRASDVATRGDAPVHRRGRRHHCHPRCRRGGRCRCRRPRCRRCPRSWFGCCSALCLTRPKPPLSRGCREAMGGMGAPGDGERGSSPSLPPPSPPAIAVAAVAAPSAAAAATAAVAIDAASGAGAGVATAAAGSRCSPPSPIQPVAVINKDS